MTQGSPSAKTAVTPVSDLTFRTLISGLAERLGQQHFPLRPRARDIHELLAPDAVHHELVGLVTRQIYRANGCGHLDAPVTLTDTFATLGAIRAELTHREGTDIDQVDLIDSIGWHARHLFGMEPGSQPGITAQRQRSDDPVSLAARG